MKKSIIFIICTLLLLSAFCINSNAVDDGTAGILSSADSATKDYLNELGIDITNGEGIENLSLKSVFTFIIKLFTNEAKRVTGTLISVIAVIIVASILKSFIDGSPAASAAVNFISVLCIVTAVIVPIKELIINTGSVIKTAAVFTDTYIPVFAGIVAASGNPKLAITYNSFALALSAFISETADTFFQPIIKMLFGFTVLTSFIFEGYKQKIIKSVRRLVIIVLSLISTVYTGLLTTQSILAVSRDSLTVRGIRFFSGTFIPVVGGGVSEAVSSVMSSLSVMRNTAGVVIIVIIILIFIPIIVDLLVWYFSLEIMSITADLFSCNEVSELLEEIASVISLLNIILFYITFVLIISTGIIIVSGK